MTDRLPRLEALRDELTSRVADATDRDLTAIAARLVEVLAQIDALQPKAKAGDPVDEIARRRTARGAGSAASKRLPAADKG